MLFQMVPSEQKPIKFRRKLAMGLVRDSPKIFRASIYRAHCAVIFAIAQLSCFIFAK